MPTLAEHDSPYSWGRLGLSLMIAIFGNVGMWAVVLVLPEIQTEFSVDRADASLPYVLTMIGFASGNLVMGRLVDRSGITTTLILSAVLMALGFIVSATTSSFLLLTIAHFLIGIGSSSCFGPLIADISHWFMKRRGIAVAIAASGNYASGAIWPLVLSGIIVDDGWRFTYSILAVAMLVTVMPMSLFLRRRVSDDTHHRVGAAAAKRAAHVPISPKLLMWCLALAGVGCCVAMSMPQVHIVAYCVDLGFGPAVGAEMLSLMLLGGIVSRLVSGWLADILGGLPTLLIGATLQCLALILFLPFDGLVSLYLVSLAFGLSQGGIVPGYAIVVREYMPPKEAGQRVGFVMFATILGMALGGWLTGVIYDAAGGYDLAFLNGIAWNVMNIGIICMILFWSRPRQQETA